MSLDRELEDRKDGSAHIQIALASLSSFLPIGISLRISIRIPIFQPILEVKEELIFSYFIVRTILGLSSF